MSSDFEQAMREKHEALEQAFSELTDLEWLQLDRELEIPDWFKKGLRIRAGHNEEHGYHVQFTWDGIDDTAEIQRRCEWFWDYLKNPATRPVGHKISRRLFQ